MGLCATAKGLTEETEFNCGYMTYWRFISELISVAYGEELRVLYDTKRGIFSEEETKKWNAVCNDDLDILIFHSDCDGSFTPSECRRIYNVMKDLHSDMRVRNYGVMKTYNMFEHWKMMFKHCADHRVCLFYR